MHLVTTCIPPIPLSSPRALTFLYVSRIARMSCIQFVFVHQSLRCIELRRDCEHCASLFGGLVSLQLQAVFSATNGLVDLSWLASLLKEPYTHLQYLFRFQVAATSVEPGAVDMQSTSPPPSGPALRYEERTLINVRSSFYTRVPVLSHLQLEYC